MDSKLIKYVALIIFLAISHQIFAQQESEVEWKEAFKESVIFGAYLNSINDKATVTKLMSIDKSYHDPAFYYMHKTALNKASNRLTAQISKTDI